MRTVVPVKEYHTDTPVGIANSLRKGKGYTSTHKSTHTHHFHFYYASRCSVPPFPPESKGTEAAVMRQT